MEDGGGEGCLVAPEKNLCVGAHATSVAES